MKTLKPDDLYEERIVQPNVRKGMHEAEMAAEEDNYFLMRLQVRMNFAEKCGFN